MAGVMRGLLGSRRFFLKAHDSPVLVHFDDAELAGGPLDGDLDSGHGDIGARVGVLLKHLGVVHLVDVIPGKDEDEFGSLAPDGIDVLDRKSTRLNSSHGYISYAVFCLKKKKNQQIVILCAHTNTRSDRGPRVAEPSARHSLNLDHPPLAGNRIDLYGPYELGE